MAVVHNILRQYKTPSGAAIQLAEAPSGNAESNLNDSAPIAANHQYFRTYTRSKLLSLCISASDAITIYTNNPSGSSPQDTIAIPAAPGQTLIWTLAADGLSKCPFSADVTTVYVTNATAAAVPFSISALLAV
jgi:hypothetical protein